MAGQSEVKVMVMAKYKFGLAIENIPEPDYITEKLFEVIEAGAVPIYLGAPNWREFFPIEHAVIDASDFESPFDLAEYLKSLLADEERYQAYHKWRTEPLPNNVKELEKTSFHWNLCRVCRWKEQSMKSQKDPAGETST
eukprot:CAMPEP_0184289712 /NCGR_PEP_ID=MMETSP1049-20130417/2092_1 /TAXON_ID=77928 /ORGANISM="Proteomonas sulcata, Strain CCMP704" /LENGTH=138 /DNA_ID=CAMNT_0026596599 /DNA_START=204 /DNA_END=620 /DNA_ORIENTATION=-